MAQQLWALFALIEDLTSDLSTIILVHNNPYFSSRGSIVTFFLTSMGTRHTHATQIHVLANAHIHKTKINTSLKKKRGTEPEFSAQRERWSPAVATGCDKWTRLWEWPRIPAWGQDMPVHCAVFRLKVILQLETGLLGCPPWLTLSLTPVASLLLRWILPSLWGHRNGSLDKGLKEHLMSHSKHCPGCSRLPKYLLGSLQRM